MINNNKHKYSTSAMCKVLKIPRSTYYNSLKKRNLKSKDINLSEEIIKIFKSSKNNYGTRKIKVKLKELGYQISRRRIARIMRQYGLVSNYTVAQFKPSKTESNEDIIPNELKRKFDKEEPFQAVVSDLTYVRVGNKWNYICLLIDLFNREIIGFSVGKNKDAELVKRAFSKIKTNLSKIQLFHTDRGSEFKNKLIESILDTFKIKRSLSMKGCPYDNAVAEATFKVFKTEFINNYIFDSLENLKMLLWDYINWYNNFRIHGTLGYLTPSEYKKRHLKKSV